MNGWKLPATWLRTGLGLAATLLLPQCATNYRLVAERPEEAVRAETFEFRKWMREGTDPDTVVIGIHGFCGAAIDYENLGTHLMQHHPKTALYAYEVRGQGKDPLKERRGDINDRREWFNDLDRFSAMVRERHPNARIVWFGESMGALIASHAYREAQKAGKKPPCDALVLSSPVVKFRDDFPVWKKHLIRGVAGFVPTLRLPLEALAGGREVQMTHDTVHSEQAETNSWHIEKHTLRLLTTLGDMIDGMYRCAATFQVPVLVLHGSKDFFCRTDDVKEFFGTIPEKSRKTLRLYPDAYHLLMYDSGKDQVINDVSRWLAALSDKP